jgi:hypothetical protein
VAARPSPDTGSNAASVLLHTRRLDLLPCSVEVAPAIVGNRDDLEPLVGAQVPDDWPAECRADNAPSICILEKLGMQRVETGGTSLKWELKAGDACVQAVASCFGPSAI